MLAYQHVIAAPDSISKFEALRDLARDFEYASQIYARLIVSEVCLPPEAKSIKPVLMTGLGSGGAKYICADSILFKFALDVELDNGTFMYGGRVRNDSLAIKSGNHELKGLTAYMGSEIPGLSFPLMVVVDYKGYRLVASSLLPIGESTIVYGSSNGGRTMHMADARMSSLMKAAAAKIGIAPLPLSDSAMLYGPSDIEVNF